MGTFSGFCAREIRARSGELCKAWLDRLGELLPVERREVFPTHALLDHIPETLEELAGYVDADGSDVVVASAVTEKARELGVLRFAQDATTHQILQEYDLLASLLGELVTRCRQSPEAPRPSAEDVEVVLGRVHRCIRVLTQASVDAFTGRYAEMIQEHQGRLRAFNRMVTHELRDPMSTIEIAAVVLAEKEPTEETRRRMLGTLRGAVKKMSQRIQSLEELCRAADEPLSSPTRQDVEIRPLVVEIFEVLSEMATAKGVELRVDREFPPLHSVLHRVEMILVNLIANGIKYSDPAKADRFVAVERVDRGDGIAFRVRDNGIGIPRDQQEAVFDRFVRAHRSRDRELDVDGAGLGLAIVAECVRNVGGRVELSSEAGTGSEFLVWLPSEPPKR